MKKIQKILFFSIILLLSACSGEKSVEDVRNGLYIMNNFPETRTKELNGEWEFYWHELLLPDDLKNGNQQPPDLVKVPSPWSSYELDGEKLPKQGYATYRLQLVLPQSEVGTAKALYIPGASSAYKLWIDGEPKVESGVKISLC